MKIRQILKSKKGFTMMEIIVVIVIIAVLAAALIPSFLRFVQDGREASMYAEARVGMVALQLLITESGQPVTVTGGVEFATVNAFAGAVHGTTSTIEERFERLVMDDVSATAVTAFQDIRVSPTGMQVVGLTYETGGFSVTIPKD